VKKWANFVNPAFVTKKGETAADVTGKMSARMMNSAAKYLNNVKQTLGNDGALYKAAIDAKKANWASPQGGEAKVCLTHHRQSRHRIYGRSVCRARLNRPVKGDANVGRYTDKRQYY